MKGSIAGRTKKQIDFEAQERKVVQDKIIRQHGQAKIDGLRLKWCATCRFVNNDGQCFKQLLPITSSGEEGICWLVA